MMITIQGLAPTTKYADVKKLIKQQCNIEDFILDNLLSDNDGTKKVRVGLADDSEGLKLMKYLDGYLMAGNYTVKVSPVGSKSAPSGPQGGYSGPSVYPNQSRNDYPNQMNTNDYNRPSHGPNTMRGPGGPQVPAGPHGYGGPQGSGGPAVWASNNNPNQWGPTSSMSEQVPQSTFNYRAGANPQGAQPGYMPQHGGPRSEGRPFEQGRQGPPVEPNYGSYQPKNGPRQNLRSIDTVETTTTPVGRYPANQYQQEKSGPTPFNITHPAGNQPSQFPQRGPNPSWEPPHQQSTENPFIKAIEDRKYPQGDQPRASKGFQPKPDTYKEYEKRRGFSPPRNPMARGMSPGRRDERDSAGKRDELRRDPPVRREEIQRDAGRMGDIGPRRPSPNRIDAGQRRVSPPGNRDEPRGRRFSPERRMSPGDRRNIPGGAGPEQQFPPRRVSPSRRLVSPGRRGDRDVHRYSPDRRPSDKMGDKFRPDNKDLKKVRPAYEPPSHAPNQPMFSSSFRPIAQEKPQYSGMRGEQPGAWNRHGDDSIKKHEDERRIQMGRERGPDKVDKRYSPGRKSRSPPRRNRSPIRDRIRRNSLSPRSSYSPRRSWALEKRRSPDAPPPPLWPGQDSDIDHGRPSRQKFPPEEKPKHQPVWEGRSFKEDEHRNRRPEERNPYDAAKLRVAKELMERESAHAGPSDRYQPKFSPRRDEYAERRDNYHRELPDRKVQADDFDLPRKPRDEGRRDDYNRREWGGGDSPGRASQIVSPEDFDKDFEDIYKRAVQFKKKTEELRKSGSRKRDDFDENSQRREDRGRHREEEPIRQQDVRRFDGGHREDQYPRDMQTTGREERVNDAAHYAASRNVREKREKAVDEIAHKILDRNEQYKHVEDDQKRYIIQELKTVVGNIIFDMFRDSDVSFIEIIIKFQAKYNLKDEAKILQDVMRSLPKHLRTMKRQAPDSMDVPTKTSRISPGPDLNQGFPARPKLADSDFNVKLAPPSVVNVARTGDSQVQQIVGQSVMPMMVPAPYYQTFDTFNHSFQGQVYASTSTVQFPEPVPPVVDVEPVSFTEEDDQDGYKLYLCRDDCERISHGEADLLRDYLISQMFTATGQYQGWSPDFTFKGLQSLLRYEVITKDKWSRDWLLNLDFSDFTDFGVLVYTKEQLWYERAAIWLPGHSRVKNIDPLEKLRLQNRHLSEVSIDKWKPVKKIVNEKGTRLYVDMPPSSARALENHGMTLSYELQQVNVYPKVTAVDKNSFDDGLKVESTDDPATIHKAIKNSAMPVLKSDTSLVKIVLKGNKNLNLDHARKIKEVVIYNIFQYHRQEGTMRTDFVKYGFLSPNCFAILPLNEESRRWLTVRNFGKLNRQAIEVVSTSETEFFKLTITVPYHRCLRVGYLLERLRQSNRGVKNMNYEIWKVNKMTTHHIKQDKNSTFEAAFDIEVDLESLATLVSLQFKLDYIDSNGVHVARFKSEYSESDLQNIIMNQKSELMDSYDVANMDLESQESGSESDKDVICLE